MSRHLFADVRSGKIPPAMSYLLTNESTEGIARIHSFVAKAVEMSNPCRLCFRQCSVNRSENETGFCGLTMEGRMVLAETLIGEENCVNPTFEVFLSGCNLRCGFCYMDPWVRNPGEGVCINSQDLADLICRNVPSKSGNLHWVGGEPTVSLPFIMEVISKLRYPMPLVWNSNMTMSRAAAELVAEIADLVLADIHFGNERCAAALGADAAHLEFARDSIVYLAERTDMIIRHLFLPGHLECCCIPVLRWIESHLPDIPVHIMPQYIPPRTAVDHLQVPLQRPASIELEKAVSAATEMGLRLIDHTLIFEQTPPAMPGFETEIFIDTDGSIAIKNLSGDFADLIDRFRQFPGISE